MGGTPCHLGGDAGFSRLKGPIGGYANGMWSSPTFLLASCRPKKRPDYPLRTSLREKMWVVPTKACFILTSPVVFGRQGTGPHKGFPSIYWIIIMGPQLEKAFDVYDFVSKVSQNSGDLNEKEVIAYIPVSFLIKIKADRNALFSGFAGVGELYALCGVKYFTLPDHVFLQFLLLHGVKVKSKKKALSSVLLLRPDIVKNF